MVAKQKETQTKKVKVNLAADGPLRGKAARNEIITDIATSSGVQLNDVKKVLDGIRIATCRHLRENGQCRIPNLMSMKLKIYPARDERKQIICGAEKTVKARAEKKRIIASPLKPLKDGVS